MHLSAVSLVIMGSAIAAAQQSGPPYTTIGGDKMGAAAYLDATTATMVVYQAVDTSVHSLIGTGPPYPNHYTDAVALNAYVARNDTPLALAVSTDGIAHMFYLSDAECDDGNYLREAFYDSSKTWKNGQLSATGPCVSSQSNLLYALEPIKGLTSTSPGYNVFRVGYLQAGTNNLCESYYETSTASWATACFH